MNRCFLYMAIALASLGCQRAEELPTPILQGKGALQIALRPDAGLVSTAAKAAVEDTYIVTQQELKASVLNQDGTSVASWDPMSEMPPVVYFEPGSYTFEVETRGVRETVNATPYYVGQTDFKIAAGCVSSIEVVATLRSMVVSLSLADGIAPLAGYKINYYAIDRPTSSLFEVTQAQNSPKAKRVYIDDPFAYGVRVEGRLNELSWRKNILVYDNLAVGVYHNLILSDQ